MAIARDASTEWGTTTWTSLTFSHTCTGSNLLLFVGVRWDGWSDSITGVTYNWVAMTKIIWHNDAGNRRTYLRYLIAPATWAHNVVVSSSWSVLLNGNASSYTWCKQSWVPDASAKNSNASASSLTTSMTTVADNCWGVLVGVTNVTQAAGTWSTQRTLSTDTAFGIYDTNGALTPAGSKSMQVTAVAWGMNTVMASFEPASTTAIKKVNSLAIASVKKINSLAIASVKKINNLA